MSNALKGPWIVVAHGPAVRFQICDEAGEPLVMTYGQDGQREQAYAMAAAPDLLAALEGAESFIAGFEDDELQEGIDELLESIRGAIAKANGGAA